MADTSVMALNRPAQTDTYNVDDFNANATTLDAVVGSTYLTTGTAAEYVATVTDEKAAAAFLLGAPICVKLHIDSGASPTMKINTGTAYPMLQAPGKAFKGESGGVYTFRYNSGSFFVQGGSGVDISVATATPNKVLAPYTFFGSGSEEIQAGTIPTQAAQTLTPGTVNQTIAAGRYLDGDQTILGDADLTAANILHGVTIFDVTGTLTGGQLVQTAMVTASRSGSFGVYYFSVNNLAFRPYAIYGFMSASNNTDYSADGIMYLNGTVTSTGSGTYTFEISDTGFKLNTTTTWGPGKFYILGF